MLHNYIYIESRGEPWELGRPELLYTLPRPVIWRGHSSFIQELVGIKKATGPTQSKTAPLKSKTNEVITDPDKQMKIWVELYLEIYGIENKVREAAINAIPQLTVLEQVDAEPTLDELEKPPTVLPVEKHLEVMVYLLRPYNVANQSTQTPTSTVKTLLVRKGSSTGYALLQHH